MDEDITLMDKLPDKMIDNPEQLAMKKALMSKLYDAIDKLDEGEKRIVCLYYGLKGYPRSSLRTIAKEMGISRERVRQLKDRAIDKIKNIAGIT